MRMYRSMYNNSKRWELNSTAVRGKINNLTMRMYRGMCNNFSRWEAKQHVSAWEAKLLNNAYVS
jgi:hypothetical protein